MEALRMLDKRLPVRIQNGSEFIPKRMDKWAYEHTVSRWTSPAPENRQITRLLNRLTAACGMNA